MSPRNKKHFFFFLFFFAFGMWMPQEILVMYEYWSNTKWRKLPQGEALLLCLLQCNFNYPNHINWLCMTVYFAIHKCHHFVLILNNNYKLPSMGYIVRFIGV